MVVSRVIGIHQLVLFNFYSFLQRFLQPHQREVTKILLALAQASHEDVPPEELRPVVNTIAYNFITERNSSDVKAVGLNSIREICSRCPLVMTDDLLQDLTQYKVKQDKSVMAASRSLMQLYRRINPMLLARKDRGRPSQATKELTVLTYGQKPVFDYLPGSEALPSTSLVDDEEDDDEDEEDSDGWNEVTVDEDEVEDEVEDESETDEEEVEERVKQAQLNSQSRIFSQKEFKAMRGHQDAKELTPAGKKARKRKLLMGANEIQNKEIVSLYNIEMIEKKRATDRASKMAVVLASREGREAFGRKKTKLDPFASTTNKQKRKNKQFMMIREKSKKKVSGRSFREKQIALRDALIKRKKQYK